MKFDRHQNGSILVNGGGSSGSTFGFTVAHAYRVRPWVVVLENVEALADESKPNLGHLKDSFREFIYAIADAILNTNGYGLPQDRKRAIHDVMYSFFTIRIIGVVIIIIIIIVIINIIIIIIVCMYSFVLCMYLFLKSI